MMTQTTKVQTRIMILGAVSLKYMITRIIIPVLMRITIPAADLMRKRIPTWK